MDKMSIFLNLKYPMRLLLLTSSIIFGLNSLVFSQEVMSSTILEKGKILYTKSEATIFIDAVGQAEVGVAYKGRIFICTLGNNFIAASGKNYLNTNCYLTEDNAARDASKK
jgi:hypothetical protein